MLVSDSKIDSTDSNEEVQVGHEESTLNPNSYLLRSAFSNSEETVRLDDLHHAITSYLGGLLPSPLALEVTVDISNVKKILELGSGSGAWSIQAASEFPEAEVTAVDLNPLPNRPLPSNITFKKADLTDPLPFKDETFDIIHARLVFLHLPHGIKVLQQCFKLLKPRGWLIIEDIDGEGMTDGGGPMGSGMDKVITAWINLMRSRNTDPSFGKHVEGAINESGCFDVVNVKKFGMPVSGQSKDPKENEIGAIWKRTVRIVTEDLDERLKALGISEMVIKKHLEELDDPSRSLTTDMYFVWSRKRVSES